jgi:hypothetical protein
MGARYAGRTVALPPYLEWSGYALLVLWGLPSVLSRVGYVSPVVMWLAFSALPLSLLWLVAWYRSMGRRRSRA